MSVQIQTDNTNVIRQAIALAEELDQIRFACGDECAEHVKKTLVTSTSTSWEEAVERAVTEWSRSHHAMLPLD